MSKWTTKFWAEDNSYSPVAEWLDSLSLLHYKAITKKILLLEKCGNELKMPHSKSLKQGLFELREPYSSLFW